jgi:hypothetical protein
MLVHIRHYLVSIGLLLDLLQGLLLDYILELTAVPTDECPGRPIHGSCQHVWMFSLIRTVNLTADLNHGLGLAGLGLSLTGDWCVIAHGRLPDSGVMVVELTFLGASHRDKLTLILVSFLVQM